MKLGEQRRRPQRLRANEALNPEVPHEATLNERIKLPKKLEDHLRSFLEFGPVTELRTQVDQLETAVGLITLFPEEAEHFLQQAPVDPVLQMISDPGTPQNFESTQRALTAIRQLAPEKFPPQEKISALQLKKLLVRQNLNFQLAAAAKLALIYPELAIKIKEIIEPELEQMQNPVPQDYSSSLWMIRDALTLEPSLHPKLHQFVLDHQAEFEKLFSQIRKGGKVFGSVSIATWYASYKILLAEEITLTPTGILLAVEKPRIAKGRPLPDRPTAV